MGDVFCEELEDLVHFSVHDLPERGYVVMEEIRRQGRLCDVTLKGLQHHKPGQQSAHPVCSSANCSPAKRSHPACAGKEGVQLRQVGDHKFSAHRIILAASIPYFHAMFTNDMVECKQDEILMQGMDPSALEALINFAYSGHVAIDQQNVQSLLIGSSFLQLQNVKDACCSFLQERLHPKNCLGVRQFAETMMCTTLYDSASSFLHQHFVEVSLSEEFLGLRTEEVLELVGCDELNVKAEEQVFEAVLAWVHHDRDRRESLLPELLSKIRLPLCRPQFLSDRVQQDELIRCCHKCRDLVDEAKDFHLMPERRPHLPAFKTRQRCCTSITGLIYAVGGLNSSGDSLNVVEVFDPIGNFWERCQPMRMARSRVGVAVINGLLYAIGGYDGQSRLSTVEVYNPETDSWTQVSSMNSQRSAMGTVVIDGHIYVCGGYDGKSSLNSVECYSPETDRWTVVTEMSASRSAAGVTVFDGRIFVSGGHDGLQIFNTGALAVTRDVYTVDEEAAEVNSSSGLCLNCRGLCPIRGEQLWKPHDVMVMSSVKQRYHAISPVTLQVVGGAVSASLYCGEVEGLSAGLVESFLVELYRCKLCQFTCGLKTSISSHLLLRHRPPALTYLGSADGGGAAEGREEVGLPHGTSPYLDLNGETKQSDEDEEFLLYNMLDNMSPPHCDISSEGGLQVAHTCEVSTLFEEEEESSIFPLKGSSVDLSCPVNPPTTQEEAQSAHLMSLGLCRISAAKPHSTPSTAPSQPVQDPPPQSGGNNRQTSPSSRRRLPCLLCPLMLTSRQILDIHVRSHRSAGGFSCICCSWTADSWEELEPHWRKHHRRRRRRRRRRQQWKQEEEKEGEAAAVRPFSCRVCVRTFKNPASRNAHQQTHQRCGWRQRLIRQPSEEAAEYTDSQTSTYQTGPLQRVIGEKKKKKTRRKEEQEAEQMSADIRDQMGFSCSLCHRKFSSRLTLRRHLGVHGGEKPFTCPHCSYSSRLKASLLQHLRTHTGEKPYKCPECPYASIDRSSLLRHCRTHSQEKPYRCQHCDYSSIQKKSLDLHTRRHHTGEAFPCRHCEYSSPDRQLLLRHVRRHHLADVTDEQMH